MSLSFPPSFNLFSVFLFLFQAIQSMQTDTQCHPKGKVWTRARVGFHEAVFNTCILDLPLKKHFKEISKFQKFLTGHNTRGTSEEVNKWWRYFNFWLHSTGEQQRIWQQRWAKITWAGWTDKETAVFLQLVIEIHVNVRYEMGNSKKMAPFTIYFKRSLCFLPQKWDNDTWLAENAPPTAYLNELQLFAQQLLMETHMNAHFLLLHIYNQFNLMENYQSICLFFCSIYPCTHPSTHHPSPAWEPSLRPLETTPCALFHHSQLICGM